MLKRKLKHVWMVVVRVHANQIDDVIWPVVERFAMQTRCESWTIRDGHVLLLYVEPSMSAAASGAAVLFRGLRAKWQIVAVYKLLDGAGRPVRQRVLGKRQRRVHAAEAGAVVPFFVGDGPGLGEHDHDDDDY